MKMQFLMVHVDMKEVTTVAKYKTVTKLKSCRLKGGGGGWGLLGYEKSNSKLS